MFVSLRRKDNALACKYCGPNGTGAVCKNNSHTKEDLVRSPNREPCYYHEHGDDEQEQTRCCLWWKSIAYRLKRLT